jgi:hypothetical protein
LACKPGEEGKASVFTICIIQKFGGAKFWGGQNFWGVKQIWESKFLGVKIEAEIKTSLGENFQLFKNVFRKFLML